MSEDARREVNCLPRNFPRRARCCSEGEDDDDDDDEDEDDDEDDDDADDDDNDDCDDDDDIDSAATVCKKMQENLRSKYLFLSDMVRQAMK